MLWSEVFDKYFIIRGGPKEQVLVFIPGSFDGQRIRYAWATVGALEAGVDVNTLASIQYRLYGEELDGPSDTFKNWRPIQTFSQEARVCRKIRVMEERWKRFQEMKKAPKTPFIEFATVSASAARSFWEDEYTIIPMTATEVMLRQNDYRR